ncbi:MAG: gluconokinase [Cyclobacteriaceae bacterium]
MECIISVEIGTNAVRIVAFDIEGNVIGSAKGSYPTFHVQSDYSEQDPDQMFITMLYVLKNLLNEKIHPKKYKVLSICFGASMHSVLPVDKSGVPLGHAIIWADNRGKDLAQELKYSSLGNKIYDATGTPIHPMSPLIKIAWLARKDKDRFKKTYKFLSIKSYIIYQLTKSFLIDYSLASATGLLNIHTLEWESDALGYAGISPDRLPEVVPVFHSSEKLIGSYRKSLGLSESVQIIAGSSDGCLATLGGGIWEEGKAIVTIEDSGAVRVVGKEVLKDEKQRFFNYLLTDKYYVSGGPTNNGGVVFEWFAKQFGEFKNAFDMEYTLENLIKEASSAPVGSDGLIFLPYLLGERAPIWDANARGTYFGINIKHERNHLVRATIEGILYAVYNIGKTLLEKRSIEVLTTHGSFASIPLCTQILADIFNKPVCIGKNSDCIAQGSFLVGATKLGIYKNLDEAARSVVLSTTYQPQKQNHALYQKFFTVFESLSFKLREDFENLAKLQHDS